MTILGKRDILLPTFPGEGGKKRKISVINFVD
jgi:hypothetical protein